MKVQVAKENFINYCEYEKGLSANTLKSYNYEINLYQTYLEDKLSIIDIEKVSKEDIESYLKYCYLKNEDSKTISHKITTIYNFHNYLLREKVIKDNQAEFIDRPKLAKHLPYTLTVKEIDKLLDIALVTVFDYRDKAMLELLYATGLRISELLNLTMNDIDLENCIVRCMGKGSKERMIPIGEYVIDSMNSYLEKRPELYIMKRDNHIFLNNHGLMLSRSGFFKMLKHRLKVCDIHVDVSPHT